MMRILGICSIILALLILALFMAPASLMGSLLGRATGYKMTLSDTEGTFWSGSGYVSILGKDEQLYALTPEPLVWTIQKIPLLWGQATGTCGFSESRDLSTVKQVSDFQFSLSEGQLGRLSTPVNTAALVKINQNLDMMKLGGSLHTDIRQLSWQNGTISLDAIITWNNMRSALSRLNTVGSYDILLTAQQAPQINITLRTTEGPLILSAQGRAAGGGFLLEGTAKTSQDYRAELQNLLMVLGVEQNGVRYFRFSAGKI